MSKAKKILDQIFEMANLDPRLHKFGVDVKLNILQPGKQKPPHGPRIKVFRGSQEYFITLNSDPNKIIPKGETFLNKKDAKTVFDKTKKYRHAFLQFWNDQKMTTDELRDLMDKVDKGEEI